LTRTPPDDPIAAALAIEGEDLESLREAAKADPEPGWAMDVVDAYGRLVEADVGAGGWLHLADRETALPPMCPVQPLGKNEDVYFFLNTLGAIEAFKASSSGKGPLGSIFAGRSRYLEWAWPRFKAGKGGTRYVIGWDADNCRQALQDACAYVGVFDDADRVRGRGAWQDVDGGLIYHAGDRVLFRGRWLPPGRHGEWVFPARPKLPRPAPDRVTPGEYGPGRELLDLLETWNWRRADSDPRLLMGWLCMAMLSGALGWRAAVYLTGEKGCGKSALQEVLGHVLGRALFKSVNTSGPGIYQKLRHDCTPVWVDELEAQGESNLQKVVAIIELIRTASSGGSINRGSQDGVSREYQCRSPFICSSINIPPMRGQDQSRFAILQLQPFPDLPEGEEPKDLEFDAGELERIGGQLLRRMIDGWARWPRVLKAFRHALIKAGHDARGADQFGSLIAAEHLAMSDADPTPAELDAWALALAPQARAETAHKTEDWRDCLQHMLDVVPEVLKHRTGSHTSIGGVLLHGLRQDQPSYEDVDRACAGVGLAVSWEKGAVQDWANARLFVPGSHPEVRKLFAGTTWAGLSGATGVWANTLQRAPAEVVQPGVCGKGLDKKRWGLFIRLAAAFPDAGEADEG
jgi:hypothetical protein